MTGGMRRRGQFTFDTAGARAFSPWPTVKSNRLVSPVYFISPPCSKLLKLAKPRWGGNLPIHD